MRIVRRSEFLRDEFGHLDPAHPYFFSLCSAMAKGGSLRIVVVGANDGRINDPIYSFVEKFKDYTEVILIEPQEPLLPYLRANYRFHPRVKFIDRAIGPPGSLTLYCIAESVWPKLCVPYARDWPAYRAPTGVTSGDRSHVERWLRKYGPKGVSVDAMIAKVTVESAPLPQVLESSEAGGAVDVLQVDAEGMDDVVIYNCGIDQINPCIIHFEGENLSSKRLTDLISFLENRGYILGFSGRDVIAVRSDEPVRSC
jgi:hypothetical protein